jgi:hypothetical protein
LARSPTTTQIKLSGCTTFCAAAVASASFKARIFPDRFGNNYQPSHTARSL